MSSVEPQITMVKTCLTHVTQEMLGSSSVMRLSHLVEKKESYWIKTLQITTSRILSLQIDNLEPELGTIVSCDASNAFTIRPVNTAETLTLLRGIKTNSAAGHVDIPAFLLKELAFELSYNITNIFNCSIGAYSRASTQAIGNLLM